MQTELKGEGSGGLNGIAMAWLKGNSLYRPSRFPAGEPASPSLVKWGSSYPYHSMAARQRRNNTCEKFKRNKFGLPCSTKNRMLGDWVVQGNRMGMQRRGREGHPRGSSGGPGMGPGVDVGLGSLWAWAVGRLGWDQGHLLWAQPTVLKHPLSFGSPSPSQDKNFGIQARWFCACGRILYLFMGSWQGQCLRHKAGGRATARLEFPV